MRNFFKVIAFIVLCTSLGFAQQQNQTSQYMNNPYYYNPGATGIENYGDARIGFRKQWAGIAGSPTSIYGSFHMPLLKKEDILSKALPMRGRASHIHTEKKMDCPDLDKTGQNNEAADYVAHHAVGGYMVSDQAGPIIRNGIYGTYAYHLPLNKGMALSIGGALGLAQQRVNFNQEWLEDGDPLQDNNTQSLYRPDFNIGAMLYHKNFFVGISTFQLLQNNLKAEDIAGTTESGKLNVHYYFVGAYKYNIDPDWSIIPIMYYKFSNPSPLSFDFGAKTVYQNFIWGGFSYRRQDAVSLFFGMEFSSQFSFNYSYDYNTSSLNNFNGGSHEILLGMKIMKSGVAPTRVLF